VKGGTESRRPLTSPAEAVDKEAIRAFDGMKVLVFGLGILGGGVAAANWLLRHGARVTVTDLKTEAELAVSLGRLEKPVRLKLGGHDETDVKKCDLVLFNPDIPAGSRFVVLARGLGKRVENEATLFYRLCRLPIVAVTGTRGKTTTCAWIEHFLKACSIPIPAGNSPTNPFMHTLQLLEEDSDVKPSGGDDRTRIVVNELPSYHLEYFGPGNRGPDIALVTNIYRDHLNRHTSMEEYADTKANIFRQQTEEQTLILNRESAWSAFLGQRVSRQRQLFFSTSPLPAAAAGLYHEKGRARYRAPGSSSDAAVLETGGFAKKRGAHNLENLLASALTAYRAGACWSGIQSALETVPEIAFRQEVVFKDDRLTVINDNAATSPDGCMAAVNRFGGGRCILIAGGTDRELDYTGWADTVNRLISRRNLIFLEGSATEKMLSALAGSAERPNIHPTLAACFDAALERAGNYRGATIVFSPGAKSFEKFDNEFERGRVFNEIVEERLG